VKRNSQSAFTLLEILLAIALVALLATALIAGSVSLLSEKSVSADDVFWQAASQARKAALESDAEVSLSFNDDQKAFIIDDGVTPRPVPIAGATKDLGVDFIAAQSNGADTMLIAGTLVDSQPMPSVTFYGDGTCSPFRVQIRKTGGAHILEVDPWTCAQMLKPLPATP
jgi:prepilin-type N-terminal cleavage/methylation domain-containing protein